MTRAEKTEHLRVLYGFACGYCGVSEARAGGVLTRDHFRPLTRQGRDSLDNLVYACELCNRAKGEYFGDAPDTRLLHPRTDHLAAHVSRDTGGTWTATSRLGAVYIAVLDLNRVRST